MIKKLIFSRFKIHDFYADFIVRRKKSPLFDAINYTNVNEPFLDYDTIKEGVNTSKDIHYITYIPSYYIKAEVNSLLKGISFNRFQGFCIDMQGYENTENYIATQFGTKSRSKVRSYVRRLETCFNIRYEMYHGNNITKPQYDSLLEILEEMIVARFNQRNETHQAMSDWGYYKNQSYDLILKKKASLFVIYDGNKPIDICLNYHTKNVFVNYIRAYDIDYSKFRLGYIDIYKQLDWCIENNYRIFDLGPGILTYKKQWCNVTYDFQNLILFNKKSIGNRLFGNLMVRFYKLKIYLDKKNIIKDRANKTVNSSDNNNEETENGKPNISFGSEPLTAVVIPKDATEINIESNNYKHLRNSIYDYLYLNFELKDSVVIYKLNDAEENYILKGKKNLVKFYPQKTETVQSA